MLFVAGVAIYLWLLRYFPLIVIQATPFVLYKWFLVERRRRFSIDRTAPQTSYQSGEAEKL
jgi:hypothetical protein